MPVILVLEDLEYAKETLCGIKPKSPAVFTPPKGWISSTVVNKLLIEPAITLIATVVLTLMLSSAMLKKA